MLRIGHVGVKRPYRRRKIGLALKLRGIEFAREQGYSKLRTVNDPSNHGILAINERMGFHGRPAWVNLVRSFRGQGAHACGGG